MRHYEQIAQDTNSNDNMAVTGIKSHCPGKCLRIAHMDIGIRHS